MQHDLVEQRGWISAQEYKDGLALAQLAPGPLAAQLAMYIGWVRGGVLGATLVSFAFIGPSFLMVLALSALYVRFGGLAWMQAVFYGVGAAVIAIIARSAIQLTRKTLGRDRLLWTLFGISALVTAWTESEIVWLFVACGLVPLVVRFWHDKRTPSTAMALVPWPIGALGAVSPTLTAAGLLTIFGYFAAAGLFVFGSGLAIVPFLHGGVVVKYHWLTERQFLDAVAVSIITPGPVVITVAFIGYLLAGPLGAVAAAAGVFLPVYLITVLAARYFRRVAGNPRVHAFVDGVTAAATGAIAGAVIVLGHRSLFDIPTALIAFVTLGLLSLPKKIPELALIFAAALAGLLLKGTASASEPQAGTPVCTQAGPTIRANWSGTIPPAPTTDAPVRLVRDVPLPGSASRFDYQSLEPASGRLFISHMGDGQLVVFDVRGDSVMGNLNGFPTVTGVLAVPAERRAYASAAADHAVVVVDDSTLQVVACLCRMNQGSVTSSSTPLPTASSHRFLWAVRRETPSTTPCRTASLLPFRRRTNWPSSIRPRALSSGASRSPRRSDSRTACTSTRRTASRLSPASRALRSASSTCGRSSCDRCSGWATIRTCWRSMRSSGACMSRPSPAWLLSFKSGMDRSSSSAGIGRRARTRSQSIPPRTASTCRSPM